MTTWYSLSNKAQIIYPLRRKEKPMKGIEILENLMVLVLLIVFGYVLIIHAEDILLWILRDIAAHATTGYWKSIVPPM